MVAAGQEQGGAKDSGAPHLKSGVLPEEEVQTPVTGICASPGFFTC
jgi:hypothetical protein